MHEYIFKVTMRLDCSMCGEMSAQIFEDALRFELFPDMPADIIVEEIGNSGCKTREWEG